MIIFAYLLILLSVKIIITKQSNLVLYMENVSGICPEYKNAPMKLKDFKMQHSNRKYIAFSYTITVDEDSGKDLRVALDVKRCRKKEAPDTCVPFVHLNTGAGCKLLYADVFYKPAVICLKPPGVCPVKKGVYRGTNCTVNMDAYNMFPLMDYYWMTKMVVTNSKTGGVYFCVTSNSHVGRIK